MSVIEIRSPNPLIDFSLLLIFQADTYEDTFIEYGQSFVNFIQEVGTVVEPPIDEFSTQSIILSDGSSHELVAADEVDPSSCAADATGEPVGEPTDAPAAASVASLTMVGIVTFFVASAIVM